MSRPIKESTLDSDFAIHKGSLIGGILHGQKELHDGPNYKEEITATLGKGKIKPLCRRPFLSMTDISQSQKTPRPGDAFYE